ncbi:MAG TPA: hypothetical protein VF791_05250 [Pyrinomonadaceae bacterium]
MNSHNQKLKFIFISGAVVLAVASVVVVTATKHVAKKQQEEHLPLIISKVRDLEAVSATIKKQGEAGAAVALEIRNKSDKAVVAVTVESGNKRDAYGINTNGFRGDEPPLVVIEPHGTITMEMPLANLIPGAPLKIAGVFYADGTEDGEEATLGTMRRQREHEKAKKSEKKGASPQ